MSFKNYIKRQSAAIQQQKGTAAGPKNSTQS